MCYNQRGDISTLNGISLKLVDKFSYLGSSVSSTRNDISTQLAKTWTVFDRLSVIWKSELTNKRKRRTTIQECCEQYWTSPGGSTPQRSSCTATSHPSRKLSKLDNSDMRDTAGEVGTNSKVTYSCGPPHIDEQKQDDQLGPIFNSSVPMQEVALKTYRKWWTIYKGGERRPGKIVLMVQHDDDDDNLNYAF